jgi:quercetin dioxygenase-like cupin family protein
MKITSPGEIPSRPAPAEYFTGTVWQDPVVQTPAPARLQVVRVSFDPSARTAWHTHPLGQTLLVLSGSGRVQSEGGPIRDIRPGDVVWIPPGEKHWHGASANSGMVHLAMQEMENGNAATWMEKVTDAQYGAASG